MDGFEEDLTFETGSQLPVSRYSDQLDSFPEMKEEVIRFAEKNEPEWSGGSMRQSLLASIAEFVLEGLHVHNRLNKNTQSGQARFGG